MVFYYKTMYLSIKNLIFFYGAGDRNRTYNLLITSQLLCQLSHASILRLTIFSYFILKYFLAIRMGLEPTTSSVTGWHSNQLNYRTIYLVDPTGLEPVTPCL